jgi:hypothetical protein
MGDLLEIIGSGRRSAVASVEPRWSKDLAASTFVLRRALHHHARNLATNMDGIHRERLWDYMERGRSPPQSACQLSAMPVTSVKRRRNGQLSSAQIVKFWANKNSYYFKILSFGVICNTATDSQSQSQNTNSHKRVSEKNYTNNSYGGYNF